MKRLVRLSTMAGGMGKKGQNLQHLQERSGPAMGEDDWHWLWAFPLFMNEMDARPMGDIALMIQSVQLIHFGLPIEVSVPVSAKLAHGVEIDSIFPTASGDAVRPSCAGKSIA